jgi:O-succinylbenzoic acid--CoA ligase
VAGLDLRVPDWLSQRATVTPHRRALAYGARAWTFAEIDALVDRAAPGLGIREGQRVGIRASNSPGFVIAVHALMRLGAVLVPINTRLTESEVAWQLHDAEVTRVLYDEELAPLAETTAGREPATTTRAFDFQAWHSIVYTSGTTGRPKGAILTYGNHWWSAIASALNLGLLPDDTWLACMPLFHVGGLAILLRSAICGMTVVVQPRFDAAEVNHAIDTHRVSIVSVVSTMLDRMLAERASRPYPASLRCVLLGGGPAPLPLLERARSAGAPVVQTYGLTETASQVVTLAPEDALRKIGSAGKPLMGSEVRIGLDGEICVNGPSVSPGYVNHPPRDGWLHTGDLGALDADGYLYVLDRRDDLIVTGGENVYPAEVEAALLAHPAVSEAGVIGVPDTEWGRRVTGFVVLRPGVTATRDELIAFCRQRLAGYKVPRHIQFRGALPRNAAGKLLRRQLGIA